MEMKAMDTVEVSLEEKSLKADEGIEENESYEALEKSEPIYHKLYAPSEDTYASTVATLIERKEVPPKLRLYQRLCLLLFILTLILTAAVAALCVQLGKPNASCGGPDAFPPAPETCTQALCTQLYPRRGSALSAKQESQCHQCDQGWESFGDFCYYFSLMRQTWDDSKDECRKLNADLVVIANEGLQTFLSEKGNLMYWIGLHRIDNGDWMWVNQTKLGSTYWASDGDMGNCAVLIGRNDPRSSWSTSVCSFYSHYICQKAK